MTSDGDDIVVGWQVVSTWKLRSFFNILVRFN